MQQSSDGPDVGSALAGTSPHRFDPSPDVCRVGGRTSRAFTAPRFAVSSDTFIARLKHSWTLLAAFAMALLPVFVEPSHATSSPEEIYAGGAVVEHLSAQVDLDMPFRDTAGKEVTLRQLMIQNRPAILTPVFYECAHLCTYTLNGLLNVLNGIKEQMGRDYSVLTYTIDPEESPKLARKKAANYYEKLNDPQAGAVGWHFLSNVGNSSRTLSEQIGFGYKRDGADYIHAAVFVVLTPDGKISRYFYGIKHKPEDVRFSLVEASEGKFGGSFDRMMLFCFRWDHLQGKYSFVAWNLVRYTSIAVVTALFGYLVSLRWKERKDRERISGLDAAGSGHLGG